MLNCGPRSFWTVAPARSLIDVCIQNSSHHHQHTTAPAPATDSIIINFRQGDLSSGICHIENLISARASDPTQESSPTDGNITFMLFWQYSFIHGFGALAAGLKAVTLFDHAEPWEVN